MDAAGTSKTSVTTYKITECHDPEGHKDVIINKVLTN